MANDKKDTADAERAIHERQLDALAEVARRAVMQIPDASERKRFNDEITSALQPEESN